MIIVTGNDKFNTFSRIRRRRYPDSSCWSPTGAPLLNVEFAAADAEHEGASPALWLCEAPLVSWTWTDMMNSRQWSVHHSRRPGRKKRNNTSTWQSAASSGERTTCFSGAKTTLVKSLVKTVNLRAGHRTSFLHFFLPQEFTFPPYSRLKVSFISVSSRLKANFALTSR